MTAIMPIVTRYASFLLYRWLLADGDPGFRVEHLQSGEAVVVPTLEAAATWVCALLTAARERDEAGLG